ncbi:tyrosine-type recombinase/integrase [Campylobacter majalis]|uniref:tyrosine-type recombinase/integrase n=1 Tax=Campylobacter majalis TaxID=2790656 RepID=UPI003D695D1A
MELSARRTIYLQVLTANRPGNTAKAKWADIDMQNAIWTIKSIDMKMKEEHKVALSSYALTVLKEQYIYSHNSEFVFPSIISKDGHIQHDTISKAIRNLGDTNKYKDAVTAHGFRATFKTLCSLNYAELLQMGITEKNIEAALAHKENDDVKFAYEREKAREQAQQKLMQWYGDYLNSLESFPF